MTDNTQPEAMRLAALFDADEWPGSLTLVSYARACAAELCRQHTRIAELEAQLASAGFTAADMATASAQGFRDGVASIAANAEGPVVNRATVIEWLDANDIEVTDRQLGGLFHFSAPPTAQAEGWRLVPVDATEEMVRATDKVNFANADTDGTMHNVWNVMLAAAPTPPTSAEGVEHG